MKSNPLLDLFSIPYCVEGPGKGEEAHPDGEGLGIYQILPVSARPYHALHKRGQDVNSLEEKLEPKIKSPLQSYFTLFTLSWKLASMAASMTSERTTTFS